MHLDISTSIPPARGAAAVFTMRQRIGLLGLFAVLVVLRLPGAWLPGRFLCEEATVFFATAWHRPAQEALFLSFAGYLNLAANAATLLAETLVRGGILTLESAPRLTMAIALIFQCVPAGFVLFGRAAWLENRNAVLASLGLIVLAPITEEVFANVLHIQFHLALAAGLVLALDVPRRRIGQALAALPLLLGPLCGPGAIVLAPLFALRTLVDRSPGRLVQTAALGLGAAVQLLGFYARSPLRGHMLDPLTLMAMSFLRLAALPYASLLGAVRLGPIYARAQVAGGTGWWLIGLVALLWLAWLARTALRRIDAATWLIAGGLLLAAVSYGAGMLATAPSQLFNVAYAMRYNFLPLVLIGIGLVAASRRPQAGRLPAVLVGLTLASGVLTFLSPAPPLNEGPEWRREVATWRADHDYQLRAWPAQWRVDLSDNDRPCPQFDLDRDAGGDPPYCESHWMWMAHRASQQGWSAAQ